LDVFDRATLTLASILEGLNVPFHAGPAPVEIHLRSAILNSGFSPCVPPERSELWSVSATSPRPTVSSAGYPRRMRAWARSSMTHPANTHVSGCPAEAPALLRGLWGKFGSLPMFEIYSQSAHATMTGLSTWVAVPMPDGTRGMRFAPTRNQEFANALLVEAAAECRDFAMIVADAFERTVPNLRQLDDRLARGLPALVRRRRNGGDTNAER
jgi:hypothetical protein